VKLQVDDFEYADLVGRSRRLAEVTARAERYEKALRQIDRLGTEEADAWDYAWRILQPIVRDALEGRS